MYKNPLIKKHFDDDLDFFASNPLIKGLFSWPFSIDRSLGNAPLDFAVDMQESEDSYKISLELPGLDGKDIHLNFVDDRHISISGEKRQEKDEAFSNSYCKQRCYGKFSKLITLPDSVDRDRAEADYKNGVLSVVLKKSQAPEMKKIEIKTDV